jgi:hypothetical protein
MRTLISLLLAGLAGSVLGPNRAAAESSDAVAAIAVDWLDDGQLLYRISSSLEQEVGSVNGQYLRATEKPQMLRAEPPYGSNKPRYFVWSAPRGPTRPGAGRVERPRQGLRSVIRGSERRRRADRGRAGPRLAAAGQPDVRSGEGFLPDRQRAPDLPCPGPDLHLRPRQPGERVLFPRSDPPGRPKLQGGPGG